MNYRNEYANFEKKKEKEWKKEHAAGGFKCSHCKQWVVINTYMGTVNRNHCNGCLWSKHVDEAKGDRRASCLGGMRPIGLTFKHEGYSRQGEIMLVHECSTCRKVSINRIAGDDNNDGIIAVFNGSLSDCDLPSRLNKIGVRLLGLSDGGEVRIQLYGNK